MTTADQVVVELEARIQQYMANVGQAEAKFVKAAGSIQGSADKMSSTTEAAFKASASSLGDYSKKATVSMTALATGFKDFSKEFAKSSPEISKFFGPLEIAQAKAATNNVAMSKNVMASNLNMSKSFGTASTSVSTSVLAMEAAVGKYSSTIQNIPDLKGKLVNPFVPASEFIDRFNAKAYNLQFNLANLSSQFNDIGVTAAAGMNPMVIALQQGTQLSQAFAGQGLGAVAKGIGAAFKSIVSPVSLVTIGLVAGTAALIQWGISAVSAGDGASTFEEATKKLDDATSRLSDTLRNLDDLKDNETFGNLTPEVKALTLALVELDRVAELQAFKETLDSIVKDKLDPTLLQRLAASSYGVAASIPGVSLPGINALTSKGLQKANYDDLAQGKGLSFDQFDKNSELIKTKALAGDVQGAVSLINETFKAMADGGPVTSINSELVEMMKNMADNAIEVAKVEAKFNGSAEAAKNAANEAKEWANIDREIAALATQMAEAAVRRAQEAKTEKDTAGQKLKIAEAEFKFGADSVEALMVKRDIDREILENRLTASGMYAEDIQSIMEIADQTEGLSVLTRVWASAIGAVAQAKDKITERSKEINATTAEELLKAQQNLQLAQAEAAYGATSVQYANAKNQIDLENLATQLQVAGAAQENIDAIIGTVTETNNVIAATSEWQSAMNGVRGAIAGIISDLASIGGGLIANASKEVEIKALKEGKTRFQAASDAKRYIAESELKANEIGQKSLYEKIINYGKRSVVERGFQVDQELEIERNAAQERERIANKATKGSGGGSGRSKKSSKTNDAMGSAYAEIASFMEQKKLLDEIELGYGQYGSAIAVAKKEFQLLQAVQKDGAKIDERTKENIHKLAEAYVAASEAARIAEERHSEFAQKIDQFKNTLGNAFDGLVSGALSFKDALGQVIASLAKMFSQKAFGYLMNPSGAGGGLGGTGAISNLFSLIGFDGGGYTGAGGKQQVAGVVHKGEVVWSQDDVRRAGGVSAVEMARRNGMLPGYADGGAVGYSNMPNTNFGRSGFNSGKVEVVASVDSSGNIHQIIREISGDIATKTVKQGIRVYDSTMPSRMKQISSDPRKR